MDGKGVYAFIVMQSIYCHLTQNDGYDCKVDCNSEIKISWITQENKHYFWEFS